MSDSSDAPAQQLQALATAVGVKAAIDKALADGLAVPAGSEEKPPPPVPPVLQEHYTPETYWTLMRLPVTDPAKQYFWVFTPLAETLRDAIIDKPIAPTPPEPRRASGSARRVGCFAVLIVVLFVLWLTGALGSMGLAPNAAFEGVFEGIAKPGPVTGCWKSTSKDNVLVKLEVQEATGQVTGKLTMTTLTQLGFAEANVTGTRVGNELDLKADFEEAPTLRMAGPVHRDTLELHMTATDLNTTGTFGRC